MPLNNEDLAKLKESISAMRLAMSEAKTAAEALAIAMSDVAYQMRIIEGLAGVPATAARALATRNCQQINGIEIGACLIHVERLADAAWQASL